MSRLPAQFVKRGMWVNLEDGPVFGRVITTDTRTANLIIAILAVATAIGTAHLWNLTVFGYHQFRVSFSITDGLYRQQQAILRTLPTPSSLVADWAKLWWVWRNKTDRVFWRSLPQIMIGAVFAAATVTVGVYTSFVVSNSDVQVLVDSPSCGPITLDTFDMLWPPGDSAWAHSIQESGRSYADNCYQDFNSSILPDICESFIKPNIPLKEERVECPFSGSICAKIDQPALSIDSGLVDLHDGFGMNLQPENRLKYRQKATCAIIDVSDRYSITKDTNAIPWTGRALQPEEEILVVHLNESPVTGNATFMASLLIGNLTRTPVVAALTKYAAPGNEPYNSLIGPTRELEAENADLFLFGIKKNLMEYIEPNDDPVFSAHHGIAYQSLIYENENLTLYSSDFPISVIGCQAQHQFCFSRKGKPDFCTELGGMPTTFEDLGYDEATGLQAAAAQAIIAVGANFDLETAARRWKIHTIAERDLIPQIPNDFWVEEIRGWMSNLWAMYQLGLADYAIGPSVRDPGATIFMRNDTNAAEKELCGMQKMRNPGGFVNVNVFGLAFILSFCTLVTILDMLLLKFLVYVKRFRSVLAPRIDAWVQDNVFHLQRRAYEALDEGPWENLKDEIPVTVEKVKLSTLSVESFSRAGTFVHMVESHSSFEDKKHLESVTTEEKGRI